MDIIILYKHTSYLFSRHFVLALASINLAGVNSSARWKQQVVAEKIVGVVPSQ